MRKTAKYTRKLLRVLTALELTEKQKTEFLTAHPRRKAAYQHITKKVPGPAATVEDFLSQAKVCSEEKLTSDSSTAAPQSTEPVTAKASADAGDAAVEPPTAVPTVASVSSFTCSACFVTSLVL